MATFKISILEHQQRKDGLFPVSIRVTWQGERAYIKTGIYVSSKQIDKKYELKDTFVIEDINARINSYRKLIEQEIRQRIFQYSAKELAQYFETVAKAKNDGYIDFVEFSNDVIRDTKNKGTAGLYQTLINSLKKFTKAEKINISHISSKFLESYEAWLIKNELEPGGINLYMRTFRALFNKAREQYNDEDKGQIPIAHYPFKKYKIAQAPITEKRALSIEQIRSIRDIKLSLKRDILARDVFMLSFYLLGMNTVDMYYCDKINKGRLSYNRIKTTSRRQDKAYISIRVEPEAMELIEKYKDRTGKRLFNFYQRYAEPRAFNKAVNLGLKNIGKHDDIKIDKLQFYAGRHSWATIARNDCKISKDDIHEALNHATTNEMKVTDIYIKKDWGLIDNANRQVLNRLFDCT